MKKKIIIIVSIIVIIVLISIMYYVLTHNIKYNVKTFKHNNISELKLEKGYYYGDLDEKCKYYYHSKKDIDENGKYYAAKFICPKETLVIEEKVVENGSVNDPDYFTVKSILYSEKELTKKWIKSYLNSVHINSCGAELKKSSKIKDNYYYVEYYMAEDC